MHSRNPVVTRLFVAALVSSVVAVALEAQERFRGGVELISLNVTVTEGGRYVTGLDQADFEVFEDGVKQTLTFFSKTQQPIALAVLLDTSASMDQRLETAQEAAIGFAKRIRPDDVMEVVDFDSQVRILQEFTNDIPKLEKAIRSTTVNGSTSLYNALYVSLKALKNVKATSSEEIRRQAIVVLSDGDDTSSLVEYRRGSRGRAPVRNGHLRGRIETGELGVARRIQRSRVRTEAAFDGYRRAGVLSDICVGASGNLSADLGRAGQSVHDGLLVEEPAA